MKVGIFILNYNGSGLLRLCLPSIVEAAGRSRYQCEVVVVDNNSVDDSRDLVAAEFPGVEFRVMEENRVLCSFNDVARDSNADIMLFLNNDLKVDADFIDPLIDVFEKRKDAFLAVPVCYSFDGERIEVSKTVPVFKWGLLKGVPAPDGEKIRTVTYTLQGGFGAFSGKKFREIGGYDDLYLPGIIDDTDICFRAWKKGYSCYYQPKSIVYHMGRASFKKAFGLRKLLAISHRNTYLFAWKHMDNALAFVKHAFFIPVRLVYSLLVLKPEIAWGFFWALRSLPEALARRRGEKGPRYAYKMAGVIDRISGKAWADFYGAPMDEEEISENLKNHMKFLEKVVSNKPGKVIEVGCGSGTMSAFLSARVANIVSVDNDPEVIASARENCGKLKGNVEFREEDAFNLSFADDTFDVAFSQGFLEHFSDTDIRKLVREQLRVAKEVIFSAPSFYYRNRDFGNERLLLKRQWREILKGFNATEDGYYLYTRRKKNLLLKFPMMYMARIER